MSVLARILGLGSIHTNPTLRRYNDVLAQAFYHHGRLCASNQATVMVLVIVFVGMISYPGIITSYNSSSYAQQTHTASLLSGYGLQQEPILNDFWKDLVVGPTWTQDPDVFARNLPSTRPQHYIAPVIINASDIIMRSQDMDQERVGSSTIRDSQNPMHWSEADFLVYATHIQQRIESIVVEYIPEDHDQSNNNRDDRKAEQLREPHKPHRLLTLKDICVLQVAESRKDGGIRIRTPEQGHTTSSDPTIGSADINETGGHQGTDASKRCLVHSPLVLWNYDPDRIRTDPDLHSTVRQHQSNGSSAFLFGGLSYDRGEAKEHRLASVAITFFLQGDMDKVSTKGPILDGHDQHSSKPGKDGRAADDYVDTHRAWQLIFNKLMSDLKEERRSNDSGLSSGGWHSAVTFADIAPLDHKNQDENQPLNTTSDQPRSNATAAQDDVFPLIKIQLAKGGPPSGSVRLVPEAHAHPSSNISAEYWLLAMAYFVMFLYISLSVGRVDLVKSKYGLGFAAVTTVFVSLLMSIGLCSVFGVTLTLMPWEILPFMIIVVGVENIDILVHAVVETSIDLPVKERVGRGLASVGVSITMTLVAELCLLVIGAMTTIPAVQEFCTFAIAAVIMDYLLQMTFFITVISIDIRRLELSDLSTRTAGPYPRYPFVPRHAPTIKSAPLSSEPEPSRFGIFHSSNGTLQHSDPRLRHQRSDSMDSRHSDGDADLDRKQLQTNRQGRIFTSFLIIGVMAYLGYIYGTTNQSLVKDQNPVAVSFWRILSPTASSEFWSTVDPQGNGGFLVIEVPVIVSLLQPTNGTCHDTKERVEHEECDVVDQNGLVSTPSGAPQEHVRSTNPDGQLDPRRPFKLLRDAVIFICLFAFWLVRVFVVPSIILAAAILLLLSYLLSPQRKLLVDLQWRFPFIVLPGDYQSKRKMMMEELLAQEARELGHEPGLCTPLPGSVDTLHLWGHETDIDQMDVCPNRSFVLTSSMDGSILLWDGTGHHESQTPLARLVQAARRPKHRDTYDMAAAGNSRLKGRAVKCLKLDPSGTFAVAGDTEGGAHVWRVDGIMSQREHRTEGVLMLGSLHNLLRDSDTAVDASKDGQIWEWNPLSGEGRCIIETKHRGGIAELDMIELHEVTRENLGLSQMTYLIAAGRDGGIQCWYTSHTNPGPQGIWTMLWGHSGIGAGASVSVLSLDADVPMVVSGYSNGAIKVWDLEHGNLVWTLSRGSLSAGGPLSDYVANGHSDRKYSQSSFDNHQPSHKGPVTKLCFHALELEDGLTGEPAPRVWLVVSSGMDETVMVWMVEWEGLLGLSGPSNRAAPSEPEPALRQTSVSPDMSGVFGGASNPAASTQGYHDHEGKQGSANERMNGHRGSSLGVPTGFSGTLSSSLPAPRLVGFMKQRGGKSMTVSNSCLYGVRRTESSVAPSPSLVSSSKQSHTSVLDSPGPSSNIIRSRRKSDGHVLTPMAATHEHTSVSNGQSKRSWELWEADLYQCIFKDPGMWGLDLAVRSIDLQSQAHPHGCAHQPRASGLDARYSVESDTITITSNGSGMATRVALNRDISSANVQSEGYARECGVGMPRPKLHNRPDSFSSEWSRGFTTGLVTTTVHSQGQGPSSQVYSHPQSTREDMQTSLLPFVETKLVHAIVRHTDTQKPQSVDELLEHEKGSGLKDIVVGFGNFIKVVRLLDEDEDVDMDPDPTWDDHEDLSRRRRR
ncbi:hypothetical protein BG011_001906 [Mortierella polycephala]|uniref:Sterol regulatory element-binding protein cleavage-activating protein n=1 Tax=Mortierella polycephala TaxID=41804 RepID=A0A9P6U5Q7_9FUNG|nr:hypothetical protein BG011_001906 [Mortierella polycephala]